MWTWPAWTPLFASISAVVTDAGVCYATPLSLPGKHRLLALMAFLMTTSAVAAAGVPH